MLSSVNRNIIVITVFFYDPEKNHKREIMTKINNVFFKLPPKNKSLLSILNPKYMKTLITRHAKSFQYSK